MLGTEWLVIVLPVVASAIHALGFWKYNVQTKRNISRPNFASWAIWALLASLNALTFMATTSFIVALQTFVGAAGCIGTFVHALVTGKFEWPSWTDRFILLISIVAIIVWRFYSPLGANLILAGAILLSFWPSAMAVWVDPSKEKPLPWILWGSAYGLTLLNAFFVEGLSWKLVMPIIGTLAHLSVPFICYTRKKN